MKQASRGSWDEPPPENSTVYQDYLAEGRGEAAYVATMLTIYAVSIAFMIGYMSFKKNKYRQWDREANQYLNGYYKRQIKHEKTRLQTFADTFNPGMTMLFATGLAFGNVGRSRTLTPPTAIALSGEAAAAAAAAVAAPSANGSETSLGASGALLATAGPSGTATSADRTGSAVSVSSRRSSRDRVSMLNEIAEEDDYCDRSGGRGSRSRLLIRERTDDAAAAATAAAAAASGGTTVAVTALLELQPKTMAASERYSSYEIV